MRLGRPIRIFVAILAATAIVASACGNGTTTPAGGSSAASAAPVAGGKFIEGSFADIKTLMPVLVNDVPSSTVSSRIYESLVQADPKTGEIKPNLGKWTVSSDGLTYSWEIDAKANWSDGKPIIAQDFLTGLTLVAKSKKTVRKSNFNDIVGFADLAAGKGTELTGFKIDPANPKKFTVTFGKVFCPALVNAFGGNYVLPTQVFGKYATATSKDEIDTAPENDAPPVASGPFKFNSWKKGDQVILDRNESYWKGAPLLDQYIYKVVADSNAIVSGLKTGELTYGTIEAKDYDDISKTESLRINEFQQLGYTYIGWNVQSKTAPALGDVKVRQALAYGLDMDAVVKSILFGHGTKMVSHHPAASWAAPDPSTMQQYKYDKTKAEQLLKDAGYAKGTDGFYAKDGKTLEFSIVANSGNKTRETLLQIATEQYKAIGVKVNPKTEAFETMVDELTTGNQVIQGWIIGWSLGLEPDPYGIWSKTNIPDPAAKKTGFNFGGFTAPGFEEAMVEGRTPSNGDCSQTARKKQYATFNKILNEQQPYNFGFAQNVLAVTQKNLQAFSPDVFGTYWNIEKWWFKK